MSIEIILGVLIILGVSLVGARKSFVRMRFPIVTEYFFLTGTEFILVGLCLGSNFLNLLDERTISSLAPILSLVLGWVGFLFGMQVEFRKLRRFPRSFWKATVFQSLMTMILVFIGFYGFLRRLFPGDLANVLAASVVLSVTAGTTAQSVLALVTEQVKVRRTELVNLIRYISSLDGLVGLTIFGLLFCYVRPGLPAQMGSPAFWLLFAINLGLGLIMGFLFNSLMVQRLSNEALLLVVIGMVTFSGGIAAYLHLSPLFVTMIMGVVVVNVSGAKERVFETLTVAERPVYLILLVLAGAMWRVGEPALFLMAGAYWSVRLIGKLAGGYLAIHRLARIPSPRAVGLTLISQGGIAIAMVLNFQLAYHSEVTDTVISIILVAIIVNELISPYLAKRVFAHYEEK
ncbi:MAG: hypothetical protein GTN81_14855 [Proteobacteria bacterium]|nr:hypothetical protein [Pseudomonadota bacterium]